MAFVQISQRNNGEGEFLTVVKVAMDHVQETESDEEG